jgi:hypothetical protein
MQRLPLFAMVVELVLFSMVAGTVLMAAAGLRV